MTKGNGVARSPAHLLHRAEQAADKLFAANTIGHLTPRQLAVLVTVADHKGLNQTGVVERTGIDRSTIAEIIPRLVRAGLLQRRRSSEDSRAKVLHLTDQGREALDAAESVSRDVEKLLLEVLPKSRRAAFVEALRAMVRSLEGGH